MAYEKDVKKSFLIYYDNYKNIAEAFNDSELGKWLRYIADYEIDGVIPDISDKFMWFAVKQAMDTLDRDRVKYDRRIDSQTRIAYERELNKWGISGVDNDGNILFHKGIDSGRFLNKFGTTSAKEIDKSWLRWAMVNGWTSNEDNNEG